MKIADKIRAAITRRLETADDRALKEEQWEADMRAAGWTKAPDRTEEAVAAEAVDEAKRELARAEEQYGRVRELGGDIEWTAREEFRAKRENLFAAERAYGDALAERLDAEAEGLTVEEYREKNAKEWEEVEAYQDGRIGWFDLSAGARTYVDTPTKDELAADDEVHQARAERYKRDEITYGVLTGRAKELLIAESDNPELTRTMFEASDAGRAEDEAYYDRQAELWEAQGEEYAARYDEARHNLGDRVFLDEARTGQKFAGTVTENYGDAVRIRWDGEDAGSDSVLDHESVRPLGEVVEEAHAEALEVERDRESTRHTTVEVTQEESDALWESVDELDQAKKADAPRTWEDGNRGDGWSWHAQGGWRRAELHAHNVVRNARPKGQTRATVDTTPDDNYDGNTSGHGLAF